MTTNDTELTDFVSSIRQGVLHNGRDLIGAAKDPFYVVEVFEPRALNKDGMVLELTELIGGIACPGTS